MKSDTTHEKGVGRREFIKEAATGVGAASAVGSSLLLGNAEPAREGQDGLPQDAVPQVTQSEIGDTVTADVIVVGVGIAGMCAGLTAIEGGAKTVMLEKRETYNARGFDDGCVNSSVHKDAGIVYDRNELIGELMKQANYRVDQRLIATWVDNSGEAIDWLRARLEPKGVRASVGRSGDQQGPYKVYHTAVNWTGQNARLMSILEGYVKEKGGDIRYQTPGVQLVRQGNGRVTSVIAKKPDGSYVQFRATRGIILSTGGYDNSPEMMRRYLRPSDLRIARFNSANQVCTGDGHNMGVAVGAAMDEPPHCMIVGSGIVSKDEFLLVMFTPWLRVDRLGRRYVNEDSDYCRAANASSVLPGHFNWSLVDSSVSEGNTKLLREYVDDGAACSAETIGQLAGKMQVDPTVLEATVARYNALARKKNDEDFGVAGDKLRPLEKPPYYAVQVRNFALVTVSGLKIDEKMRVLDAAGKVIPGLYAAGNTSGGFFSDTYPRNVHGISHGRAITFGRLAAKNATAERGGMA